jgi:hypothetical protein
LWLQLTANQLLLLQKSGQILLLLLQQLTTNLLLLRCWLVQLQPLHDAFKLCQQCGRPQPHGHRS